jgi:hypothetical protein
MIRQIIVNARDLQRFFVVIDDFQGLLGNLAFNAPQRKITTRLKRDIRFNLPSQVKSHALPWQVIGPDNRLFLKFPSHHARIYAQCDFPCPAGRDDPVITGHKAASGMSNLLDMKVAPAFIEYSKGIRQRLPFKDWREGVAGFLQMDHRNILRLCRE